MSEINKRALEGLRQPLEDSYIQINQKEIVETDFVLIGATNPCDCGFYKSETKRCICTRGQIDKFQRKMRSPLFQRFDIFINNSGLKKYNHTHKNENLNGEYIYKEVLRVRKIQTERILKLSGEKLFRDKTEKVKRYRHIKIDLDMENEKQIQRENDACE
jgi:magnesium chelatase family protein